jgi:autotransporter-associated beta strand protein
MAIFSWRRWLKSWFVGTPRTVVRRPRRRLSLEALEDRVTPTTFTWTGAGPDNLWSDAANWGGTAPTGLGDDLVFPAGPVKLLTDNNLVGATFHSLQFSGSGYSLTDDGITLGTAAAGGGALIAGANTTGNTIAFGMQLATGEDFSVDFGASLTLSGQLSSKAPVQITKKLNGTLNLTNDNSSFLGPLDISQGIVQISNANALGVSSATTTVQTNAQLQVTSAAGGIGPINNSLRLNGNGAANDGALLSVAGANTWAGPIELDSNTYLGASAGSLTISGQINDLGAGYSINKEGAGQILFTAANAYRGTTTVDNGTLTIENPNALGNSPTHASQIIVNDSLTATGTLQIADPTGVGFTVANETLFINGTGVGGGAIVGVGAVENLLGNNTWSGPISLGSVPPQIFTNEFIGVAANTTLTVTGVVSDVLDPVTGVVVPNPAAPPQDRYVNTLNKVGLGTLVFAVANTYEGTTIVGAGTLIIQDSNALGQNKKAGAVTTVVGGFAGGATLELQVNPTHVDSVTGTSTQLVVSQKLFIAGTGVGGVGALYSNTGINIWAGNITLNNTAAIGVDPAPLPSANNSYFTNDFSLTVSGAIQGPAFDTFEKVGLGDLILPGANTYTGPTLIQAGWVTAQNNQSLGAQIPNRGLTQQPMTTISLGAALHLKPLTAASPGLNLLNNFVINGLGITYPSFNLLNQQGAILNLDGNNVLSGNIQLNAPSGFGVNLVDPAYVTSELTLTGDISGAGDLDKLGLYRLRVQGHGTYTGNVDIQQGVLTAQNSTALGAGSATSTTTVESGATLELQHTIAAFAGGVQAGVEIWGEQLILNGTGSALFNEAPLVNVDSDNMWRGGTTLATDTTIAVEPNSRLTLFGAIDDKPNLGPNGSALTVTGGGGLALAGANTYNGLTTVVTGTTLTIENSGALGSTKNGTVVQNGASLEMEGGITVGGEPLNIQGAGVAATPTTTPNWFTEGPAPLTNGITPGNENVTGRVTGITSDPTDPNVIYLSAAGGGAWKSIDNGLTWQPSTDGNVQYPASLGLPTLPAQTLFSGAIAVAPSNPQVLYLGTGEADNSIDSYYGEGVFQSTDSGKTWTVLENTVGPNLGFNPLRGLAISRVVVDPNNPNLIYVATSDLADGSPPGNAGVWRWNGSSWFCLTNDPSDVRLTGTSPSMKPNTPAPGPDDDWRITFPAIGATYSDLALINGTLYMALGTSAGSPNNGVFRCSNPAGATAGPGNRPIWDIGDGMPDSETATEFPTGAESTAAAPVPNNGNIKIDGGPTSSGATLYAAIEDPKTSGLLEMETSVDGGVTWTTIAGVPNYLGTQGFYDSAIAVSQANLNDIYVAGQNQILNSLDGGMTWTDISTDALGNGPHSASHSLSFDANGNVLVGTDGGVWRWIAGQQTWQDLNGSLLSITNVNGLAVDPSNPKLAIAGSSNNGVETYNGTLQWLTTNQVSGGVIQIDPLSPNIAYSIVGGAINGVEKSSNGGQTWSGVLIGTAAFGFSPLVLDTVNPNRLVVGNTTVTGTIAQSLDGGATWTNLNAPRGAEVVAIGAYLNNIYDPNTIYASSGNTVEVTRDGGISWTSSNAGMPAGFLSAMTVDPTNSNIVYAVFSNFKINQVYQSVNGGATWAPLPGSFPANFPARSIALDPRPNALGNSTLYVGTDNGVIVSLDNGKTWQQFGAGLPNVSVTQLVLNQNLNTLSVATNGRGVFTLWLDDTQAAEGALVSISGTNKWTGPVTLAGNTTVAAEGTQTLQNGVSTAQLSIVSSISDGSPAKPYNLTKIGFGNVILAGNNTYGGTTDVQQGQLIADNPTALGQNGAGQGTTVENGAALVIESNIAGEPLTLNGDGILFNGTHTGALHSINFNNTYSGPITLATNSTIGVDSGTTLTVNKTIANGGGNFTLTKALPGTLVLSAANTYGLASAVNPSTLINQGAIQIQNNNALGAPTPATPTLTTVANGAQLQLLGSLAVNVNESVDLTGSGISNGGALLDAGGNSSWLGGVTLLTPVGSLVATTAFIGTATFGDTLTISGQIGEAGPVAGAGLTKAGAGKVLLTNGTNSYTGLTTVNAGTLSIDVAGALGQLATAANGVLVNSGGSLELKGTPGPLVVANKQLTLNGAGDSSNPVGALSNLAGNNSWQGSIALQSSSAVGAAATTTLTISGTVSGAAAATFSKVDAGTVVFPGPNAYLGKTTVNNGILLIEDPNALGASGGAGTTVNTGATLQASNITIPAAGTPLTLNGLGFNNLGALDGTGAAATINTWNAPITLASNASIGADANTTLVIGGAIGDSGKAFGVTTSGAGTIQYTGAAANTYTGTTAVSAGTLQLNKPANVPAFGGSLSIGGAAAVTTTQWLASGQLPANAQVTVNSNGTLNLNNFTDTAGALQINDAGTATTGATGVLTANSLGMLGNSSLILGNAGNSLVLGGTVTAASDALGTPTITGTGGKVSLNGANRTFQVNAGGLPVDLSIAVPLVATKGETLTKAGTGVLDLQPGTTFNGPTSITGGVLKVDGTVANVNLNGGTLAGNGSVGTIATATSGTVSPGGNPGTLTSTGTVTWNAQTTFNVALFDNGGVLTNSLLQVAGNVDLGNATLAGTFNNVQLGDSFTVLRTTGGTISGVFATSNPLFISGRKFTVAYMPAVNPTSVVLTAARNNTTLTITPSDATPVYGEPLSYTIKVTPEAGASAIPDGDPVIVTFDGTALPALALTGGQVTFTPANQPLAVGNHSLSAVYNGSNTDSNFNSSNAALTLAVAQANTTTTLSNPANPSVYNQAFTITATVAPVAPAVGFPSGTVTFTVDGTAQAPITLVNGQAALVLPALNGLATGTHLINASYSGNGNDAVSSQAGYKQVINKASTSATLSSPTNPSVFGAPVTFNVAVSAVLPGAGVPTGSVTFTDGGTTLGSAPLDVNGNATFTTPSTLAKGNHSIVATYAGDSNFAGGPSNTVTQKVTATPTVVTVTSGLSPSISGQAVTFTTTVAPQSGTGTPTGTVQFSVDGVALLPTMNLVNGMASFTVAGARLPAGNHTVSVSYGGDPNFNNNVGSVTQVVNKAATGMTLTGPAAATVYGQSATFTATLSAVAPGTGTPTGSVIFTVNGTAQPAVPLTGGAAVLALTTLPVGNDTITASYAGDSNFTAQNSGSLIQQVNPASSSVKLTAAPAPAVFGQAITFTAAVAAVAPGGNVPTGNVTFVVDGMPQAPAPLVGGQVTLTLANLSVGNHTIAATYPGDPNFLGSAAAPLTQAVKQAPSSTTLVSSINPAIYSQPVTFTATVAAASPGAGLPTGTITFLVDGLPSAPVPLNNGQASLILSSLTVGGHTISASYSGDGNFLVSASTILSQQSTPASSAVTLAAVPSTSVFSQSVSFTATVTPVAPSTGVPTGSVIFTIDGVAQPAVALDATGVATLPDNTLSVGSHNISAAYQGDFNFLASNSSTVTEGVSQDTSSVTLASSAAPSVSGQSVTITATVAPAAPGAGIPTGTVTFAVDGTPQTPVTLSGGTATINLPSLTTGSHSITASYSGDTGFLASATAAPFTQQVNTDFTTTALVSSVLPSVYGQAVAITATVSANGPGAGTPTGTVTFSVDTVAQPGGTGDLQPGNARRRQPHHQRHLQQRYELPVQHRCANAAHQPGEHHHHADFLAKRLELWPAGDDHRDHRRRSARRGDADRLGRLQHRRQSAARDAAHGRHGDARAGSPGSRGPRHHRCLQRRHELHDQHRHPESTGQPKQYHDHADLVGQPGELRRDVANHGDDRPRRARCRYADRHGHLHGRWQGPARGERHRRHGAPQSQSPRRRPPHGQRRLLRRQQLRQEQHRRPLLATGEPGRHHGHSPLLRRRRGLRPADHLHGHRHPGRPRRRHADRHGHVHDRRRDAECDPGRRPRDRHAQHARRRQPYDLRQLRRRQQPHRQRQHRPLAAGEQGREHRHARLIGGPVVLRSERDGDRECRGRFSRRRHADRVGHLHRRWHAHDSTPGRRHRRPGLDGGHD